ncbi:hypothetical protein Focb16_v015125 [Fusarium oxysporum f. sp. cubense]|uniref:Uncharacterized protein n=1 Tax=Fusarium oxysporum f. sp. cubense TaxID=61366 RepID=A0A559KUQ3_FUSOC|nr:hypothetical protein Focb16_v015125 [Fusarium oxysporum f. sp. cubense]
MGLLAKLKFKLRKRLAQGTAEPVAHGMLGLVSLERVCKQAPSGIGRGRNQSFFAMNALRKPICSSWRSAHAIPLSAPPAAFHWAAVWPYCHDSQQSRTSVQVQLIDQACLPRALVALESQLVRLCEICTVCLGMNGVYIIAYSIELAHSFELRHQRNQDFDGLRTLDTPHSTSLYRPHRNAWEDWLDLTWLGLDLDLDLDRILGYNTTAQPNT